MRIKTSKEQRRLEDIRQRVKSYKSRWFWRKCIGCSDKIKKELLWRMQFCEPISMSELNFFWVYACKECCPSIQEAYNLFECWHKKKNC